jgi:hypothetical protein
MSHLLPPAIRRRIKWVLNLIRGDKVGTTLPPPSSILPRPDFQVGKTNMHPNIQALTQLPHPGDRTIHGDIPIYYLQVPAHSVDKIRGPDAPDPPLYVVLLLVAYSALILSLA